MAIASVKTNNKNIFDGIQEEKHGIYLDDLKDDDAEMLQIYVGRSRTYEGRSVSGSSSNVVQVPNVVVDDDAESGNGPSLPMSPHSVEGAIGGPMYDHRNFR
jgi:phosphatidate phosphatase LPIN